MTTQELYDLISKGFDDIKTTLTSIDNRLRNVETDVAELKGRRLVFKEMDIHRLCCYRLNHRFGQKLIPLANLALGLALRGYDLTRL